MANVVTFVTIPPELQLDILMWMDVPSILAMKVVCHHFHDLITSNEDVIVRGSLQNVECIGPHSILLQFYPLKETLTLDGARRIHQNKQEIRWSRTFNLG